MNRNRGDAAARMAKLFVGTSLTNLSEPESLKTCSHLTRLENGRLGHDSSDNGLNAYEFGLQIWLPVLEEEGNDFLEIPIELVQRGALAVSSRESRDVADIEPRIRVALHDGGVGLHMVKDTGCAKLTPAV